MSIAWDRFGRGLAGTIGPLSIAVATAGLIAFLMTTDRFTRSSELYPLGKGGRTQLTARIAAGRIGSFPLTIRHLTPLGRLVRLEIADGLGEHPVEIRRAWIELLDCPDRLVAPAGQRLGDGEPTIFEMPEPGCGRHPEGSERRAILRIIPEEDVDLAWLVAVSSDRPGVIELERPGAERRAYLTGYWVWRPDPDTGTRLELLAWMWDLGDGMWIVLWLLVSSGLVAAGQALFSRARRSAIPLFLMTLGLTGAYVAIAPPLHAPDEPDHLLAFAELQDDAVLKKDIARLARRGHLERIKFRPREAFTPPNMAKPYDLAWGSHVRPSRMDERSPLTIALWIAVGPLVSSSRAPVVLLALRSLGALLFAAIVALGAHWIRRASSSSEGPFPLFVFLVPALPFFAMHVSNNALFASLCTLSGCLSIALLHRRRDWPVSGLLIGGVFSALVLSSLPGLALGVWVAVLALERWLTALRIGQEPRLALREAARFWGGLLLGLSPLLLTWNALPVFEKARSVSAEHLPALGALATWQLCLAGLLLAGVLLALELGLRRGVARLRRSTIWRRASAALPLLAASLLGFALALFLLASPFLELGITGRQTHLHLPLGAYIARATTSLATSLSFREPELFVSTGYWSGFGWMDTWLDPELVRLLAGAAGVGLLLLIAHAVKTRSARRASRLLLWIIAALGAGVSTAAAAHLYAIGIAGRYLIGFYGLALALCFAGYLVWLRPANGSATAGPSSRARALIHRAAAVTGVLACVALHAHTLHFLLRRYFG